MKKENRIFGFQYWYIGSNLQTGTHFSGERLDFGREMHRQYAADGNTIASWFEGTKEECDARFGRNNW